MLVLPIYLVLEESEAMKGVRLDAVNSALHHIHRGVACDPIVNSKVRVGVISFSNAAEVLVPSTQLAQLRDMPGLMPKGGINYTAAFTLAKACIRTDIDALKAENFQVFRPILFLVTSNKKPLDEWQDSYQALTGEAFIYRPHIIAIGFDVLEPDHIRSLATVARRGDVAKRYAFGIDSSRTTEFGGFIGRAIQSVGKARLGPTAIDFADPPEGIYDLDPM